MISDHRFRYWLIALTVLAVAGCASGPQPDAALTGASAGAGISVAGAQAVKWTRVRPGCRGECPKITMDSLIFPGQARLNTLVDHALASMTWLDQNVGAPYGTVADFEAYFWRTANLRDDVYLSTRVRYHTSALTVLELDVGQYRTGMAHGISGTQFLNWDNATQKVLTLDDLLVPGQRPAFEQALRAAHQRWLQQSPAAQADPANFGRMWPFVSSDNVGLTALGLVVKYQPYEIAPYVAGKPELLIPVTELRGILKPAYMPSTT